MTPPSENGEAQGRTPGDGGPTFPPSSFAIRRMKEGRFTTSEQTEFCETMARWLAAAPPAQSPEPDAYEVTRIAKEAEREFGDSWEFIDRLELVDFVLRAAAPSQSQQEGSSDPAAS